MTSHSSRFVCFLAAAALAHGFQAQAPTKGSIEGQVVNGKTGTPLKRATVRLVGIGMGPVGAPIAVPIPPAPPAPPVGAAAAAAQIVMPNGMTMPAGIANRMPLQMSKETDEQGR